MSFNAEHLARMAADADLKRDAGAFFQKTIAHRYSYNFTWLGLPIVQYPQDMVAVQEILWRVKPELIIETGVAHGGSLILSASLLELIGGGGRVVGVDVDIRAHNRRAIEEHPLSRRIDLIEGSSTDGSVVDRVRKLADGRAPVMVMLDSNHAHAHVLEELRAYSPLVTEGSYLIVFDTVVEELPSDLAFDRPWGPGNNPMTAVREFLSESGRFVVDHEVEQKLLLTVAPGGYLRCVAS